MGRMNELICDYLGMAENYADFWNGTRFGGRHLIQSRYLARQDREYHRSGQKEGVSWGIRRDVLMRYEDGPPFYLGLEIMSNQDYTMPVRIMDYDAQELKRQMKDIRFAHMQAVKNGQEQWDGTGEFLYGVKKEDKLLPVHTVALYCGMEDYDGKESILGMTDYHHMAPGFRELFEDYPIKVYRLKDLQEENYQTGLREIIGVFKRSGDREAIKEYYEKHKKRFGQMDELSIEVMGALIGKKHLKKFKQENGGVDMCKAFDDERAEGRAEGREENIRQSVMNLMKNLKLTSQQAMEALGIPRNEWEKYQGV